MPKNEIVLDPVDHITVDALGKPGQRIFYIQAAKGNQKITLLIEKIQLQALLEGIKEFLEKIQNHLPEITKSEVSFQENDMQIQPPIDPLFHAGDMGLAYDENRDLACIFAHEAQFSEEGGRVVRFWCSRAQMTIIARWGAIVVRRGRPICPQCGLPIDPEGHFCPKKNGHKHGKK